MRTRWFVTFSLTAALSAEVALAAPPAPPSPPADVAERTRRAEAILRLGGSRAAADQAELLRVLAEGADWERALAAKALRPIHAEKGVPLLERLQASRDSNLEVEATVALHRLRPSREALQHLERLRDRGARLRVAFQTGEVAGRPTYPDEASSFFRGSVAHALLMTRLDGALGLVELGGRFRQEGLDALEAALASSNPADRRLVVRVLRVQYDEPGFRPLLETGAVDPDETVRTLAESILARLGATPAATMTPADDPASGRTAGP